MPIGLRELRLSGVAKAYHGRPALRGVDLCLRGGEIHALVGKNGAGKTTLVKVVAGVVAADSGRLSLDGAPLKLPSPATATRLGIAVVHQETGLFPNLSISEYLSAARPPCRWLGPLPCFDSRESARRARLAVSVLDLDVDPSTALADLPADLRRLVDLARAVAVDPRILVLDEPTSRLAHSHVRAIERVLRQLAAKGVAILVVSHDLREVLTLADQIVVLREGAVVARTVPRRSNLDRLQMLITAREPRSPRNGPFRSPTGGRRVLVATGVSTNGLPPTDVEVDSHEIVLLSGLERSRATCFARCVAGAMSFTAGMVVVNGRKVSSGDRGGAAKAGIAFLPGDRGREGLIPQLTLEENVSLGLLGAAAQRGRRSSRQRRSLARRYLSLVGIDPALCSLRAAELSGGNQQKLLLARCFASEPDVLVLEQPAAGLDVEARTQLESVLERFVASGGCVLLVDAPERWHGRYTRVVRV